MRPTQNLAVIRAQSCTGDFACFLIDGMRHDRKRMHVQPNARTLNNHRRPPDLQMWLYQRECSPTPATHESLCNTRPSASASPYTNYSRPRRAKPARTRRAAASVSRAPDHIPVITVDARDRHSAKAALIAATEYSLSTLTPLRG
jgi:hypothetical protein